MPAKSPIGRRQSPGASNPRKPQATLEFADDVEFWLTRKRVKNINIRIKLPDGRVEVSAPARVALSRIKDFVLEKRGWIRKTQAALRESPQGRAEAATDAEREAWRECVEACTPALVEAWQPIIGVRARKLAYRNMKSRWGSCQPSTGRICINTRLALYPPECLEYVVVHELCHLRVRGHGPDFHALMDVYMPDWRDRRAKLR